MAVFIMILLIDISWGILGILRLLCPLIWLTKICNKLYRHSFKNMCILKQRRIWQIHLYLINLLLGDQMLLERAWPAHSIWWHHILKQISPRLLKTFLSQKTRAYLRNFITQGGSTLGLLLFNSRVRLRICLKISNHRLRAKLYLRRSRQLHS